MILKKSDIETLREMFNTNLPNEGHAYIDGEVVPYKLDVHKEKTEKYVGRLCQYLAHIKGYKYWPKVRGY